MSNLFLDSLVAAVENEEPTDDILNEILKSGQKELDDVQLDAADTETGNTGSPSEEGDPNGSPDNSGEKQLPSAVAAQPKDGQTVPPPGYPEANPASEAFGFVSKDSANAVKNMSEKELQSNALKAYFQSTGRTADNSETLKIWNEKAPDGGFYYDRKYYALKTIDGNSVIVAIAEDDSSSVYIVAPLGTMSFMTLNHSKYEAEVILTIPKQRKLVGRMLDKVAKANNRSTKGTESEVVDNFDNFNKEVALHRSNVLIPIAAEKAAYDKSGNTGDPATGDGTPVSPSGEPKPLAKTIAEIHADATNGNPNSPGVNGTPVSKSGDSVSLPKTDVEKVADDKTGNPPSPGVDGDTAPSFESFISACEQNMIKDRPGTINLPESVSMESYIQQLGLGELAARACESSLTAAEKRALPDSMFGLPDKRKYPMSNPEHVSNAIAYFRMCPEEDQRELAKNILKFMRKYNMMDVSVTRGNPFLKYYPEANIVAPKAKAPKPAKD